MNGDVKYGTIVRRCTCVKINQLSIWVIKRERERKRQTVRKKNAYTHTLNTRDEWRLRKDQQFVVLWSTKSTLDRTKKNVMLIRCVNNEYLSINSLTRCYCKTNLSRLGRYVTLIQMGGEWKIEECEYNEHFLTRFVFKENQKMARRNWNVNYI